MSKWIAIIGLVFLTSCVNKGVTHYSDRRGREEPDEPTRYFTLYRIDIDEEALAKGAQLPFKEPPLKPEFGYDRKAGGQFTTSDTGFVKVRVGWVETYIGLDGRPSQSGDRLLDFSGKIATDRRSATIYAGDLGVQNSGQRPSEITFDAIGADKVVVQAYTNGVPGAYRYFFSRTVGEVRPTVEIPWRP